MYMRLPYTMDESYGTGPASDVLSGILPDEALSDELDDLALELAELPELPVPVPIPAPVPMPVPIPVPMPVPVPVPVRTCR